MINKKRLIRLTQKLISIDSQNPPGDEFKIARFVATYLRDSGLKPKIYEFKKRRPNVLAVLEGRKKKYSLLITPHLDTVPAGRNWRFAPFSGRIQQHKIYGLGATDCKGNLACSLEAMRSLIEDRAVLDYNLIFAATSDEESGSIFGLIPLLERGILRPTQAVVLDADDFKIIVAQKGLIHLKVKLQGRRAHGAYPWRGINAIDMALNILREIKQYKFVVPKNGAPSGLKPGVPDGAESRLPTILSGRRDKYLRAPTVNIGTIKGGDKVNLVADWSEFEIDLRFLPGMSAKKILRDLKNIIRKHTLRSQIEIEGIQAPYRIDESHALVKYLSGAIKKFGLRPKIKGSEGATTITFFQRKKIPAIATGFGSGGCAHMTNEFAKIDNLYKGALVLEEFLKNYKFSEATTYGALQFTMRDSNYCPAS